MGLDMRRFAPINERVSAFPLRAGEAVLCAEGGPLAGDEVHLKVMPDRIRTLLFAQPGGAKPIAATEANARCLAAAWGGLEGGTPPH